MSNQLARDVRRALTEGDRKNKDVVPVPAAWLERLVELGGKVFKPRLNDEPYLDIDPAWLNHLLGYIESARSLLPAKEN